MRIVITGASGFVGRQLIPQLQQGGAKLLLVGRDPEKLRKLFPGEAVADYQSWTTAEGAWDLLLHLAVLNNDQTHTDDEYQRVNVELSLTLAEQARQVGIPRFINVSSVQALYGKVKSGYAQSKMDAAEQLRSVEGISLTTVYLPLVYGDEWSGKLRILNRLPKPVAKFFFRPLSALKPTVDIQVLADYLLTDSAKEPEVILSDGQSQNAYYLTANALTNWVFALGVAACLWWVMLLAWVWIRLESSGPGIFAQERIGKNGARFRCYKFRTMHQGTRQAGSHEISESAVTGCGAVLRRTKLDELPQIWNILKGEMQLVGPRPGLPMQTELLHARDALGVFSIKPGITGWSQIHDLDMSTPELLAQKDAQYIKLRCLVLDLQIILATALGQGQGDRTSALTRV